MAGHATPETFEGLFYHLPFTERAQLVHVRDELRMLADMVDRSDGPDGIFLQASALSHCLGRLSQEIGRALAHCY